MIFYLLALLPIAIWAISWCFNKRVILKEAAAGTAAALLVATIFQVIESSGAFIPSDTETWSGRVQYAQFEPRWKEYYEYAVYRTEIYYTTDSKGNSTMHTRQVFDHWEPTSEWHENQWWTETELGTFGIDQARYQDVLQNFGDVKKVKGDRTSGRHASRMLEGSPFDDQTVNRTGYVYPVTDNRRFDNRLLKAKDSLYSFTPVPPKREKELFPWPTNSNRYDTDRLLGTAKQLWDRREWDQMNAALGPIKNVNLIAIGFPAGTAIELGMLQEHYWKGGKKNDLVLTFGGDPKKPDWAYVFGWTEKQAVKRLLENRLRSGEATIDAISRLVRDEYKLLAFEEKFKHVDVEVPWWYYLIFFAAMAASQAAAHFVFWHNGIDKIQIGKYKRR